MWTIVVSLKEIVGRTSVPEAVRLPKVRLEGLASLIPMIIKGLDRLGEQELLPNSEGTITILQYLRSDALPVDPYALIGTRLC